MKMKTYSIFTVTLAVCVTFLALPRTRGASMPLLFSSQKALTGIKTFKLELERPALQMLKHPGSVGWELLKVQVPYLKPLLEKYPQDVDDWMPNIENFPNDQELGKRIKSACGAYGVEVLTLKDVVEDEKHLEVDAAYLHVRITDIFPFGLDAPGPCPYGYIYTVTTCVQDYVCRRSDPKSGFRAIIWAESRTRISEKSSFVWDVRDLWKRQLDKFIKDYLAANLQKAKSDQPVPEHEGRNLLENIKPVRRSLLAGVTCSLLFLGLGAVMLRKRRSS